MKARKEVLTQLKSDTETLLKTAAEFKDRFVKDAINWGNLHCVEACYVLDEEGKERYQLRIEECDPGAGELKRYIIKSLAPHYKDDEFEVITEW